MKRSQEIQRLYKQYKRETDSQIVDPRDFARWMQEKGWPMPTPPDPLDILAKQLTNAIREETRVDAVSGLPYKANLSFTTDADGQGRFWVDVDEAPRNVVLKCLVQRREQVVCDCTQLSLIQDHWNNANPSQEPIQLPLDFGFDVELRKINRSAADDDEKGLGA